MGAAERAGDPVEGLDQVRLIRRRCQRRPPLARVSTRDQPLDRQTRALTDTGCIRVFADKKSGRTADRVELHNCLDYLRAGDTLVVLSLDRLSRSLHDLITLIAELRRRGIGSRACTRRPTHHHAGRAARLP